MVGVVVRREFLEARAVDFAGRIERHLLDDHDLLRRLITHSRSRELDQLAGLLIAEHATAMYAKNLLNFVTPLVDTETGALAIDWEDEIIQGCLVTRDGRVVHPILLENIPRAEAS